MKENITAGKINLKLSLTVWLHRQKNVKWLKQIEKALPKEC